MTNLSKAALRNRQYRARLRQRQVASDPYGGPRTKRPLVFRFWRRVRLDGPVVRPELGPCWDWAAATFRSGGYGAINVGGKATRAHRVGFFLMFGRWPSDMLLHSCDRAICVNPHHLREGGAQDNAADMVARKRGANGVWRAATA